MNTQKLEPVLYLSKKNGTLHKLIDDNNVIDLENIEPTPSKFKETYKVVGINNSFVRYELKSKYKSKN